MTAEVAVLAALVLVPGLGAALAFARPGEIAVESRIALAFGLGFALVAAVATLLALAHVLTPPAFVAGIVAGTAGVWALALRRASLRAHAAALSASAKAAPAPLAAGLAVLLATAVTASLYPVERSLEIRAAWRYWADGLEVAAAGHVPAQTQQWGMALPTTVSKVALNAFEGGVSFLLGDDPLPPMHGILVVTAVGLVAALLALGRELGLAIFAPLVPALVVLTPAWLPLSHEIAHDLRSYTAENIGRMVALGALLAGIHAVRSRSRAGAVVTGLLLALAGLVHLVPTLVAGAMLVLYALAWVIVDRGRLQGALATGAVAAAVLGVSYAGVIGASGGDLGLRGGVGSVSASNLPPDVDPTRSFAEGELVPRRVVSGHFLIPPLELIRDYRAHTIDRRVAARSALLLLAALGLASVVMAVAVRSLFPLTFVAWGLGATMLAAAAYFSARYDTAVPGNWGVRRLFDYAVLVPGLLVPALLEALARPLARRSAVVLAGLSLLAGLVGVVAALDRIPRDRSPLRAERGLAVIDRVAATVPCDARMLANASTAGTWEATTGRRAVTEGHAPYLRPRVLDLVLPVVIGAKEFFDDPAANRGFLAEQRIEYLVVVEPNVWVGMGGALARKPRRGDADAVAALPGLETIVRDRWVSIFSVRPDLRAPAFAEPRRCPL